ncbi:MAG: S-layer homology domain-containing protein [Chrysiogenetes bacterium]|nr:S-layer homology domain-containing protein [Chrysiogenetes bacterium]
MKKIVSNLWLVAVAVALLGSVSACGDKSRAKEAALDTPEHHTKVGNRQLDNEEYDEALKSFELALSLKKDFTGALVGRSLVFAQKGDWEHAENDIEKALSTADSDDDEVVANIGMVRYLTAKMGDDWLSDAEDHFKEAIDEDGDSTAARYYMGIAYKRGLQFGKAGEMFRQVLDLQGDYSAEARREWRLVQEIQLAAPGSEIGKQIALIDKITRADLAALLIEELNIQKLFKQRGAKFDTSFHAPGEKAKKQAMSSAEIGVDIQDHVLRADILEVLKLGIRGLELDSQNKFNPSEAIAKAEFAMMIEDILVKISGDTALPTKFIDETSPFPDVRSDAPYFNAVMVATSRQILEPKDLSTGEFAPKDAVSGAKALLAIRKLHEALQY